MNLPSKDSPSSARPLPPLPAPVRRLLVQGWLQAAAGGLGPLLTPSTTPAVGAMHTIGLLQGALLIGAGASWSMLRVEVASERFMEVCLSVAVWGNWVGALLAVLFEASANLFDKSFSCSLTNTAFGPNAAVAFFINLASLFLPALTLMIFSLICPKSPHESLVRGLCYILAIAAVIFVLKSSIFAPHSSLIDPALLSRYPLSNVLDSGGEPLPYCPYSILGIGPPQ